MIFKSIAFHLSLDFDFPCNRVGQNSLHFAAIEGSLDRIISLSASPRFIEALNARSNSGYTPLHYVVECLCRQPSDSHFALFRHLLTIQALDINAQDLDGRTPVFIAASFDHLAVFSALVQAGARLDIANSVGKLPIHQIADKGQIQTLTFLNGYYKKIDHLDAPTQFLQTPLYLACRARHTQMVTELLLAGASISTIHEDGNTLFHLACETQDMPLFYQLSPLVGPDDYALINHKNDDGKTALHIAVALQNFDLVNGLIKLGAVRIKDRDGYYPDHYSQSIELRELVKQVKKAACAIQ